MSDTSTQVKAALFKVFALDNLGTAKESGPLP